MPRNVKLILAYRGCPYLGWQETGVGPTIEGELQKAVERLVRHPVQLQAASRTDAGVHAEGQVVNFRTENDVPLWKLFQALNNLLPREIRVVDVTEAEEHFHPTLDANAKHYRYRIAHTPLPHWRHLAWHCPNLDWQAIEETAQLLVGTHDFAAFCNQRKDLRYTSTVRTLYRVSIVPWEGGSAIDIIGNNFLYKMVRNLVGTLVAIGRSEPIDLAGLLQGGERTDAGVTAPAHGLSLSKIYYKTELVDLIGSLE